ncbi:virulence factor Mce family protein [Mycolicibacterium phlei]|uniref:Mammalian cell entry protein n=1 Tax=Mycolicibacterium phlei DSM 43239 = CCUG 21000 TaxID=1226750 RepID=A0A5N5UY19_MYCPH|nr:virulence factor Mce family protein [Mycolicibacterium phlei]VEG07078.1 virulence factor Mce family protein [Mycobacteroides chelonae]AMO58946.1 mce related protein [Mycolicibacterium phlei]KAB7754525.1 mammalian cell entry protein [Mycolicibacterium phlei DSM 43239 = CCUG 21000]KXW59986.1 mammalian cell entry protein [Mycolicibacterium phlei DSM 43070]KXW65171.1 mammalian cell entry protein [Mycolicibacterium phlei DSM 43239 = CCUG 21000]
MARRWTTIARRVVALSAIALMLSSCGSWRGIANVPLPGGPGTGRDAMTIYVQMPDTLALNVNSRVRVADVYVGRVRAIELKNWVATLTLNLEPGIKLPKNVQARIGQTSLLGSQHVELNVPEDPSPEPLRNGDTIPLANAEAYPSTERVLASIATILSGGGVQNLEVIQTEIYNVLNGRADQIRDFLTKLDTFTDELNQQRADITRAIDATDRLLSIVAQRNDTLDRVLTEFPPLIEHFAETRDLFADAVEALGRISKATDDHLAPASDDLRTNLQNLQRPLKQIGRAAPYTIGALKLMLTAPFSIENVPKVVRGDYLNVSLTVDLTLSAIDNGILSGTGVSGMLRALEQAWGRDPATMIPDVRFTPNPHDAPGGPLVERGE